jgi:hypothetical protein
MKFIDTFNEGDKKKLIKKAKLIYSALKKGTITRSDGVKFSYELGDNMVPSVVDGEIELFAFITKITERTYCPINEIAMSDLIIKKFEQFNIKVDLQIPKSIEIVKYEGKKPWEESLNEEIDIDKERNRVKTVHKAIRKGIVNVSGTRFRYELPEEYTFHVMDEPHLQVTAIKFTFYNKDISKGGDGLPLKIWRIEDGKDVYLNKMLTGQDVGDITYNDEYAINTKTGVDYVNAKNKVRNRYRNFDINAIMTTPSDPINEEIDRDHLKKMKKKGELIYQLYKTGKLISDTETGEIHYTYELSDGKLINAVPGDIFVSPDNIKIKYHNELTNKFALLPILESIKKRFYNHGITFNRPRWTEIYVDKWEEPINESEDKGEVKARQVFKALRKGMFKFSDRKNDFFRYVLPENYEVYRDELDELCIKVIGDMDMFSVLKFDNGTDMEWPTEKEHKGLYEWMEDKVKEKFEQFDIKIIFVKPEPINESEDKYEQRRQKMIKKGKTVFKAFRKGVLSDDQPDGLRFSYELSDDFTVDINNLGIIIFTAGVKIKELNRACDRYSPAYMVSRIRNKFYQFDVVLTYPHVTSDDVERWEEPEEPINEEKDNNLTDKDRKKIELIYGLFKTGKYKVDDLIYTYVLPDDFWTSNDDETGDLIVVLTMNPQQRMKLYATLDNGVPSKGYGTEVETQYHHLHNHAKEKVKEKFHRFNIDIIF